MLPSPPDAADRAGAPILRLSVPNTRAALEPARQAVIAELAPFGLSERALYRVQLVLEEMLMNRLWHAWPEGGEHLTRLSMHVQRDSVHLCFDDDGLPFDPLSAPPPPRPGSLAEAEPGGLGLLLTRRAVRDADYQRVDGRNRLTLAIERG